MFSRMHISATKLIMISYKNRVKLCMTVLKFRSKKLQYNSYGLLLHVNASYG